MSWYVVVHYSAGRAGIGWAEGQPRTVRIPHIGEDNARETARRAAAGEGGCFSSLPVGVVPDSVRVYEEPPTTQRIRSR